MIRCSRPMDHTQQGSDRPLRLILTLPARPWGILVIHGSEHLGSPSPSPSLEHALTPTLPDKSTSKDMIGECTPTYSTARNVKAARQPNLVA